MPFSDSQLPLYEVKANLFKALAHPYRIRVLELLADGEEVSVAHLQTETGLEASHLSQHLSVLRRHRVVVSQRRASHVYYRLADRRTAELLAVARELLLTILSTDESQLSAARDLPSIGGVPATGTTGTDAGSAPRSTGPAPSSTGPAGTGA